MRILEVNHGYPSRYRAGSEIYTQTISHGLTNRGHTVAVFTREEDPYRPDFNLAIESDEEDNSIRVFLANHARSRDRYQHQGMDEVFREVMRKFRPDVVHFNHLNHLSLGLIQVTSDARIPMAFTLHDYWLACPRGQFIQMALGESLVYPDCPGQENERCSKQCMSRIWGGVNTDEDNKYWTQWVHNRMSLVKKLIKLVNIFISPSQYLRQRIVDELNLPSEKIIYEPYGFNLSKFVGRKRERQDKFVFGYIGRIVPAKGVDILIKAFGQTTGDAMLRIWGRSTSQDVQALNRISNTISSERAERIEWLPEYKNENITSQVFNHVDSIVVPSIWDENSPLVIQEALQSRVLVITSIKGGMGELIKNGINGLTFQHRSVQHLADTMQKVIDRSHNIEALSKRGYLGSESGDIHNIENHARNLEIIFKKIGGMS